MVTSESDSASQASEQRYRHLFEHMPICIFVANLTVTPVTILEANRRAELVYGYTAADLVGMPAVHLVPEEARPAVLTILQKAQQSQTVTTEITVLFEQWRRGRGLAVQANLADSRPIGTPVP